MSCSMQEKKNIQEIIKNYSFQYRSIEAWNKLDAEVLMTSKTNWIIVDLETG